MNIAAIEDYFNNAVPVLSFQLVGESILVVDVATLNNAKRLATGFDDYIHPDVLKFLEYIAATNDSDINDEERTIITSKGYKRFCFYLTVYCGRLERMLEMHSIQYLPTIAISLDTVVNMTYYPCMTDAFTTNNKYAVLFDGNIESLLTYCRSMNNNYMQVTLIGSTVDLSAVDILGYVQPVY